MLTERKSVTTYRSTGAAATPCTVAEGFAVPPATLLLDEDPELCELIAEVDAILRDAVARLLRRPPSRQVTGCCAAAAPRSPSRSWAVMLHRWSAPAPDVRAVQRSPP